MRWQDLKSRELDAMSRDTVVIVPTAAIEQHSLHLPVSTDTTIADGLSARLDEACDDRLLVLPTFWLGASKHHMPFTGTITAELDTWSAAVFDIVNSILQHGFTKVIVLNCHGGNNAILNVTLEKVKYAHPDASVLGCTYWHAASEGMAEVRETGYGGMGHACEMETSVMLVLRPDLVDMSSATEDVNLRPSKFTQMDMLSGPKVTMHHTYNNLTKTGAFGDPTSATTEKGERFIKAAITALTELVADLEADRV